MWLRVLVVLLLAVLVSACGEKPSPKFKGSDISGADFGRKLALTDHNGRSVTLESFKGKLVVLFFGYTHCPDVCPTTLSDMAIALKQMKPEAAEKVQVLFVSLDTERDSQDILRSYVPYFHPGFLGLTGSQQQVVQAAREFKVAFRKHVEAGATDYLIDHSAGSYVFDPAGRMRLYLPFATPPADIAHDLAALLRSY